MLYRLSELAKMQKEEGLMLRGVKGWKTMPDVDAEVEGMTNKKELEGHRGENVGPMTIMAFSRARKVIEYACATSISSLLLPRKTAFDFI